MMHHSLSKNMIKTFAAARIAATAALVLAGAPAMNAQVAGKDLAMDFRTSTSIEGMADSGSITGHIVSSPTKVRIDMSTTGGRAPTPLQTFGPVSMIVSDSGQTITYLDTQKSQYMMFRPAEMLAQAQEMGGVRMDFSGSEATVTRLGAGPAILGHPTVRYRVVTGMTMTISGMGQQQSVKVSSTTEYHYPTDISSPFNPFSSITGTDMLGMFGGSSKEFAAKLKAAEARLPKAPPLRTSTTSTVTTQGISQVTKSRTEVTSVRWVNADPKVFEIPAGYTAVELPTMGEEPPTP
jgi:hypothetical protein